MKPEAGGLLTGYFGPSLSSLNSFKTQKIMQNA
jgi:hypothetical protein